MPIHCCDPVMKSCLYCKYGLTEYNGFGDIKTVSCRFDFEDDEPYSWDIDEFNKWYNGVYKWYDEVYKSALTPKPTE